jgi:hypothetical protein
LISTAFCQQQYISGGIGYFIHVGVNVAQPS